MYIIGDAAYPLKTWLMTGFKDNDHLTAQQKRFTNRLSSKRMVIKLGISLLKGRFRKLKVMVDIDRIRFLPKLVIAAYTLHNFCIYSNDEIYDFLQPLDDDDDANNFVNIFANDNNAVRKRAETMDMNCLTFTLHLCLYDAKKYILRQISNTNSWPKSNAS